MCFWGDCTNCPYDNKTIEINWVYPYIYPQPQKSCNKGKIMKFPDSYLGISKCDKCKHNPKNCPDFEETKE